MALHKPFDRSFYVLEGATMTNGRSLNLTKGQFGVFDTKDNNNNGAKAVTTFNGKPRDKRYRLQVGTADQSVTRSKTNKSMASFPFSLDNILDLRVSTPKNTEQSVDDVIVGYNGIDDSTALTFKTGTTSKMYVELSGEPIGMMGYNNNTVVIPVYMDAEQCSPISNCEDCDPCTNVDPLSIVLKGIETLKDHKLRGNNLVTDYIDVTPIRECENEVTEIETAYAFYTLTVSDTGDSNALALVQTQYENAKVSRIGRKDAISTYEILVPEADGAPEAYVQTIASLIKGCKECPTGYTSEEGAVIYGITLEDDGADRTSDIEAAFSTLVEGTVEKSEAQIKGTGYYTLVLTEKLSSEDFTTVVEELPTVVINYVGTSASICDNDTATTIDWNKGEVGKVSSRQYTINLPDTECGEDRLAELQLAFPKLEVRINTEGEGEAEANITGGCQTQYIASVKTNMIFEECDPIFKDYFISEAPQQYDLRDWKVVSTEVENGSCKVGIRIKGKVLEVHPDEALRDELGFIDSAVNVRVSGGYVTEVREGIGSTEDTPFAVEYKSRYARRTHLGGNFYNDEDRNRVFFTGEARHHGDLVAKMLLGEESVMRSDEQRVTYAITLRRDHYSQSFGGRSEDNVTFTINVGVGREAGVEKILNNLAEAAGIPTVKAFGV